MNTISMKLSFGTASILAAEVLRGSQRELVSPTPAEKAPVMVVPGFLCNDLTTAPLRLALRGAGYHALPWRSGLNLGPTEGLIQRLTERVSNIVEASGRAAILVGHSLGGLYAREIAKISPQLVRMVITIGSPVRALERGNDLALLDLVRMIERASGRTVADLQNEGLFCDMAAPLPVPCVAIYSKRDRIAPWQTCLQRPARFAENVEVNTTHLRMIVSASVYGVILDRIARVEAPTRRRGAGEQISTREVAAAE